MMHPAQQDDLQITSQGKPPRFKFKPKRVKEAQVLARLKDMPQSAMPRMIRGRALPLPYTSDNTRLAVTDHSVAVGRGQRIAGYMCSAPRGIRVFAVAWMHSDRGCA